MTLLYYCILLAPVLLKWVKSSIWWCLVRYDDRLMISKYYGCLGTGAPWGYLYSWVLLLEDCRWSSGWWGQPAGDEGNWGWRFRCPNQLLVWPSGHHLSSALWPWAQLVITGNGYVHLHMLAWRHSYENLWILCA